MSKMKDLFSSKAIPMGKEIKAMLKEHGNKVISEVTLAQAYGGMRGVKGLTGETSELDPYKGIRFRGYSIPELQDKLPTAPGGEEPLPEGLFYLMLTGELPTEDDVKNITADWAARAKSIPEHVFKMLDAMPIETHPMTQFIAAITALQTDSTFAKQYREGMPKTEYWNPMFEDAQTLIARLPRIAAYIYRRTYKNSEHIEPNYDLDWAGNFAHMLGFGDNKEFTELMRLYLTIHADHETGNVSAHTTRLVGSALSDAYLSFSAAMGGLAGPLHGLANQEVLRWVMDLKKELGGNPNQEQIKTALWATLNKGQVIPGYGHAVLRKPDPRYMAQREFALKHLPEDELFKVVSNIYEVAPDVLMEHGKAKNPWPNVDAHSGVLLVHYGLVDYDFYTVMFGVSRALGVLASLTWDRALGLSLERPKSVTTDWVKNVFLKEEK